MPDLADIENGWQVAALALVLFSIILAGPRLRAFLRPPDDDPAPASPPQVIGGYDVSALQLPTQLAQLLTDTHQQVQSLTARVGDLESETRVLRTDRDALGAVAVTLVAWIDAGAVPPPPTVTDDIRTLLASLHTQEPS